MTALAILNVQSLTKTYATGAGKLTVLKDISFVLPAGGTCSILGPSGSGKTKAKNPQVKVVLAGMQVPPNLGAEYATGFERAYRELASENNAALIPFLLEGVGGHRDLNQPDLIHPTVAGHRIVADLVWRTLEPILRAK